MTTNTPTPQSVSPVYLSGPMFSFADLGRNRRSPNTDRRGNDELLAAARRYRSRPLMAHIGEPDNGVSAQDLYEVVLFIRQIVCAMDNYQFSSVQLTRVQHGRPCSR